MSGSKPTDNDKPEKTPNDRNETEHNENEQSLFPSRPSGRTDYGTNDTRELLERIPSEIVDLKLDDVLHAVKAVDNLCDYPKCKARTNLMGQDCEHCRKRFCFKHGLPEVHGCGDAVKKDERKKFLHPKPLKTVRQEQELSQAKKKLQAKLKDMQVGRMQKTGGGAASNGSGGTSRKKKGK